MASRGSELQSQVSLTMNNVNRCCWQSILNLYVSTHCYKVSIIIIISITLQSLEASAAIYFLLQKAGVELLFNSVVSCMCELVMLSLFRWDSLRWWPSAVSTRLPSLWTTCTARSWSTETSSLKTSSSLTKSAERSSCQTLA